MDTTLADAIDEIDAAVFSGDTFHDTEAREHLLEMCKRWTKALNSIEDTKT